MALGFNQIEDSGMNIDWSEAPDGYDYAFTQGSLWECNESDRAIEFADYHGEQFTGARLLLGPGEWVRIASRPNTMTPEEEAIKVEEWKAPHIETDVEITATFSERLLKGETNNKYQVGIKGAVVDVYDILMAYGVTNPADQHAIKKMLMPGKRGHKDAIKDREEAIISLKRAIELEKGK